MSQTIKRAWETEEYREKMAIAHKNMNGKKISQLTLESTQIKECNSATDATRQLGYSFGGICRVCRGERQQYKAYRWIYVNE